MQIDDINRCLLPTLSTSRSSSSIAFSIGCINHFPLLVFFKEQVNVTSTRYPCRNFPGSVALCCTILFYMSELGLCEALLHTAFPLLSLPFSHRILQSNLCSASSLLHFHISVALHLGLQRWGSCSQVYFLPLQSRVHLCQWQGGRECPLAAILDMCRLPAVLSLPHGSSVWFYGTQRSPTQQYELFGSSAAGFGGACFVVGIRRSTCVSQTFTLSPLLSVEG